MANHQEVSQIIDQMWAFAERICNARFIPQAARGDASSVFYLIAMGHEMGLRWTHALRSLYMTPDGKVGLQGDVMLALLYNHGFTVRFTECTDQKATVEITRPGSTEPMTWTFSIEDAKRIQRWDPENKRWTSLAEKSNFRNYPRNMLMWRALANCARFAAADLLGGIYLPDELEDIAPPQVQVNGSKEGNGPGQLTVGVKPLPEPKPAIRVEAKPHVEAATEQTHSTEQSTAEQAEPERAATPATESPNAQETRAEHNHADKPEPRAKAATPSAEEVRDKISAICEAINEPYNTARAKVVSYFRGYLDIPTGQLPKDQSRYAEAIATLEEALQEDPGLLDQLRSEPFKVGHELAQRSKIARTGRIIKSWPEKVRELAEKYRNLVQYTPEQFLAWCQIEFADGKSIEMIDPEELHDLFRLLISARGMARAIATSAWKKKMPLSLAIRRIEEVMGKPIEELDYETLEANRYTVLQAIG